MRLDSGHKTSPSSHFAVALLAIAALTGCKAQIDIDLTAGPVEDAEQVVVQIEAVELRRSDNSIVRIETANGEDADLLQYRNGQTLPLVSGHEIGATTFTGVRLIYADSGAYVRPADADDGDDFDLITPVEPPFATVDFTLKEDDTVRLLIDLDLRFSLADRRDTLNRYQFQPYLRAAVPEQTGSISGRITDRLINSIDCRRGRPDVGAGVAVYVFSGGEPRDFLANAIGPIASSPLLGSAGNYRYEVRLLTPGSYTVALTCDADRDDPLSTDTLVFTAEGSASVQKEQASTVDLDS